MKAQFYENEGRRCGQTMIKSVATGDKISFFDLDKLTGRGRFQITTPIQIAYGLSELGVDFIYPVKPFFLDLNMGQLKEKIDQYFGENILKLANLGFIEKARKSLKKNNRFSLESNFDFNRVDDYLGQGYIPIVLINYDTFVGREDKKSGHYLIIHEMKRDWARIMDCGPYGATPDKKVYRRDVKNSLMHTPLDYGLVFVQTELE